MKFQLWYLYNKFQEKIEYYEKQYKYHNEVYKRGYNILIEDDKKIIKDYQLKLKDMQTLKLLLDIQNNMIISLENDNILLKQKLTTNTILYYIHSCILFITIFYYLKII